MTEGENDRPHVLSCTTMMEDKVDEVGRCPCARLRSSHNGRAAGRREMLYTVTAAVSHDEHHFTHPDQMIQAVDDPTLTLTIVIARRHIAYLLQRYPSASSVD